MNVGEIEITGVDLIKFIQKAFELSSPQGMGHYSYKPGGLSDEQAKELIGKGNPAYAVSMDYVQGRAVKMHVWKDDDGRLSIDNAWFDHSDRQLIKLLEHVGIAPATIDQARDARAKYDAQCIEKGIAWLKEKGGKIETTWDDEKKIGQDVMHGLRLAKYALPPKIRGDLIMRNGGNSVTEWVLI
jgi:hypothetical protein